MVPSHAADAADAADAAEPTVTVRLEDRGEALVNPAIGWTVPFYSNRIENDGPKLEAADKP